MEVTSGDSVKIHLSSFLNGGIKQPYGPHFSDNILTATRLDENLTSTVPRFKKTLGSRSEFAMHTYPIGILSSMSITDLANL